ncbi:GNAT family N-acetyltransferase [Shewanella sp. C32]|uniref:GNAT family N-acetyltransferase n=1 Tax=Shewanella electrica TaxID=515560 RepID=A0ABT2FQG5_9GAMM|nr:GNAT family N-acetyltransferase [Shewanella electrica]MCH1926963.1 GNAT family N-acetyltransferase [Shewanella electrica]MCS4558584.1 GNAT family N-acetyltransferase [Shewanella electrica]
MISTLTREQFAQFWPTFQAIVQAEQTYAYAADITEAEAYHLWCEIPQYSFAWVENGQVLGIYYLKANAMGPGNHVCNCGYMVSVAARGKGIARKMCQHSQQQALAAGFTAMQFNCVVSTNEVAVTLWQKLGFDIVGTLPKAYRHGELGLVDCYVMYKTLKQD